MLLAFQQTNVQFTAFNVFGSILLVQYAVIGGLGWISGAAAGAAAAPGALVSQVTNDLFPNLNNVAAWLAILSGLGVIQLLWRAPDGLASLWAASGRRLTQRLIRPAASPAPPTTSATTSATSPPVLPRRGQALDVRGLSISFGGVVAVDDVSFEVAPARSSG